MAKTDIGPKIGIQGEREFRQELNSIQTGLKTLGTEMKAVTSEFAGQEKTTEALTEQNKVLEKQTYSLNEKLALQKKRLEELARAYGEADPRTQKMQQAVNLTTAELNKNNAAIKANAEQIAKNDTLLGKYGIDIGEIGSKLGLSTTATSKLTSAFSSGAAAAAAFGAAVAALAKELIKLSDAAAAHADEVATLATQYNTSAESIQKFQYMAELVDVSVETITGSLSKLTRNMNSARDGTGAAAEAFQRLGVSVTNSDGSLRSANEVFGQAIDALGQVGNATERDALAMEIFGKSAMDLNPLIAQGSEGLRELSEEAENSGYVMSEKMVAVLTAGDDATQRLDKAMDGLKNTIGAGVTPIVAGWKMIIAEAADDMAVFIQKLAGMRDGADEVTESVNAATGAISSFRDITAEDLMTPEQRKYKEYVDRALKYQQETGQKVTIYRQDVLSDTQGYYQGRYNSSQNISVNLQLDGYTVGKATTPYVNKQNYSTGGVL